MGGGRNRRPWRFGLKGSCWRARSGVPRKEDADWQTPNGSVRRKADVATEDKSSRPLSTSPQTSPAFAHAFPALPPSLGDAARSFGTAAALGARTGGLFATAQVLREGRH